MTEQAPTGRGGTLKRLTVRDAAENALREMILAGDLPPRTRLNEVALAEELGISRGPLREAIQKLGSEGLLQIIPHKGAFVTALEEDELRQLYELRIALETFSVRKVCDQLTTAEREEFRRGLDAANEAIDAQGPYPTEVDFHLGLVGLSGNPMLLGAAKDVDARISIARNRSARQPARARQAHEEHLEIADALIAGDVDKATTLLETHLWHSFDNAVAVLMS